MNIRKMQTAAGGPLKLTSEEQKYLEWSKMTPEQKREYRNNRAKTHLQSGPNITNFWEAFQTYIGNRDPKNPHLNTGEVPNPGMRNPKQIISSVQTIDKFKNILKNYNPYAYRKPKLPEIKISDEIINDTKNLKIDVNDLFTDNFIKYLEKQTGRKIKRIPYKNTKDGNIYKEGFSFVDENGKEIAHIAGNLKGKNVWVESSYVDPEFRHKGLGKQMYFDFNDNVYNTYGTTLHSSALQRVGYVDGGGMSPSNRLWKSLTDNKLATTEGSGFDWWNIMANPSKIKTAYRKQGGKMNILEFLKNGSGIHIKKKNRGKFTSYCGGKVTDECIQKGKNSSNPAIRKRATFAANARKWKHKDGGVLYIFQEGGKTSWWNKAINFMNNSGLGDIALNALSTYTQNKQIGASSDVAKAKVDKDKVSKIQQANLAAEQEANDIQQNNVNPENPNAMSGDIVKNFIKNKLLSQKMALINQESNQEKAEIDQQTQQLKNQNTTNMWAGIGSTLMQGLGHIGQYMGNKQQTNVSNT